MPSSTTPQPNPKTTASVPVNVDPTTFPRTYVIQKGDNFSIIAQKIYGRASWAGWLADQNGVDPSKLANRSRDYVARSKRINRRSIIFLRQVSLPPFADRSF